MKFFTFSGISSSLTGTNAGEGVIDLARDLIDALPAGHPDYHAIPDQDHFRSYINMSTLLGELENAVRLNGSQSLCDEATELAPKYGKAMAEAVANTPRMEVNILAHSQGTNNAVFSLLWLIEQNPQFFNRRVVRVALLDPKVGRNYIEKLFGTFPKNKVSFLFLQSQNDILGNQALLVPKLISAFPLGDHIWVYGLDHGSIREWDSLKLQQKWMTALEYIEYTRAHAKKIIALRRDLNGKGLNTTKLLELQAWAKRYPMRKGKICEALIGFAQGKLPHAFQS